MASPAVLVTLIEPRKLTLCPLFRTLLATISTRPSLSSAVAKADWLSLGVYDVKLDGVVVLYGSAVEDGDPWFALISPGVEDFSYKI